MKEFNTHLEAASYVGQFTDLFYAMEEEEIPFDDHRKYVEKNVGKNEFHVFETRELLGTGIYSVPYVDGKDYYDSKGIGTAIYMPYRIKGELFFVRYVRAPYPATCIYHYSHEFMESYKNQTGISANTSLGSVAAWYFSKNHHQYCLYNDNNKFIFTVEGVAIAIRTPNGLYVTTEFDNKFKMDFSKTYAEKKLSAEDYKARYNRVP